MSGAALSGDSYQLALKHGAKDEDIQMLRTRDAILSILQEANIEADICEDVADACELNDLDALTIASGLLSIDEIADSCFLTKDEAEVLSTNCAHKAFSMGVFFGRDAVVSPRRLGTFRRSPKAADVPTASTVPPDEGSGPFGSDSLAFDSPAQSPSAKPRKPRPPVSQGVPRAMNGADTQKSPLAAEVSSTAGPGPAGLKSVPGAVIPNPPAGSAPSPPKAAKQPSRPRSGTNGVSSQRSAAAQQPKPFSARVPAAAAAPATSSAITPSSNSFVSSAGIAVVNDRKAASNANAPAPPSMDAQQKDLFSGNHGTEDSMAATPRFAQSTSTPAAAEAAESETKGASWAPPEQAVFAAPPQSQGTASLSGHHIGGSTSPTKAVPPSALVAAPSSSASSQAPAKQPTLTAMAGSAPDSPKTPRDGPARDTLTVESCPLNTGSSVQPQPASISFPVVSHPDSRLRSPGVRPISGPVTSYPGPAAPSDPTSSSVPYAAAYHAVAPPQSAPTFRVGRQIPASMNVNTSPMRSPRSTTRPRTPTGPLSRFGVSANYPPPEALDDLGSTFLKYPGVLPHFMRPTAAHEHRLKAEPEDSRSASPPSRRPRSVAATAHFIQPTASYVAKVAQAPSESSTPKRAMSACVAPTAFAPFCLHTEMRLPQKNKMTTDELRIADLKKQRQEEAAKRRTQLRRLQHERARTESSSVSSPHATKAKPFQLASVARHERELQARKAMMHRQAEEEARTKLFRARQFNPNQYKDLGVRRVGRASEPGGRKATQPKGPSFLSDDRLGYRRDVLEGRFADSHEAHRVRHAESMSRREEKARLEAQRMAKEREFKARPAPNPSARFKLDASKVKPITVPKPFALSGVRGSSAHPEAPNSDISRGLGSADPLTPMRVVTPQGVMSEFMRSLRV